MEKRIQDMTLDEISVEMEELRKENRELKELVQAYENNITVLMQLIERK